MFVEGFEKEAGLKHLALAGMLAVSPAKAHARTGDMLKTVGGALQKTEVGQGVKATADNYLRKAQNIHLWGKSGQGAAASAGAGGAAGSKATSSPNLYLKDAKRLQLDYGKFSGSAEPGGIKANYNLGKGFSAEGAVSGGERRAGISFKREF